MKVAVSPYGRFGNLEVSRFDIRSAGGTEISLISHGAVLASVKTPDRRGNSDEITLGFDTLEDYVANRRYFGATIGRYGNRIAGGRFSLNGTAYILETNNGPNHLHGGFDGFDRRLWDAEPFESSAEAGVLFTLVSPDGDQGYPGTLNVRLRYTLTDSGELRMEYEATSDGDTIINLTNHTFWNLAGAGSGTVRDHVFQSAATAYLPVDEVSIPLGEIRTVEKSPFDFRTAKPVGREIDSLPVGYDHCLVLPRPWGEVRYAGTMTNPASGRKMELYTDQPGFQFYTAGYLPDGTPVSGGRQAGKFGAFCLETQNFPDAPNRPDFPRPVLRPGQVYRHRTIHRFSAE